MASFVSVFIQFVCEFMLILVHLFHWFESCWCKVHSRRICLSLSIGFQNLFEICSPSPKKISSFSPSLGIKKAHLFLEEKQNALNEVGGFDARNCHHGLPTKGGFDTVPAMQQQQQQHLHSFDGRRHFQDA